MLFTASSEKAFSKGFEHLSELGSHVGQFVKGICQFFPTEYCLRPKCPRSWRTTSLVEAVLSVADL